MIGFLKNLFSGKAQDGEEGQARTDLQEFDVLKYDGLRAMNLGKMAYAERCFEQALNRHMDMEVMQWLVEVSLQLGKTEQACNVLQQMQTLEPARVRTYLDWARILFVRKRYEEMLTAALKATELEPDNAEAYFLQAEACQHMGDVMNALLHLTQAVEKKADFAEAYLTRARLFCEMHQLKEARQDIDALLRIHPDEEEALLLAADIALADQEHTQAQEIYAKVLQLNPFCEKAYQQAAASYFACGQPEEGFKCLNEAIEVAPSAALYQLRSNFHAEYGHLEEAQKDKEKAEQLQPHQEERKA